MHFGNTIEINSTSNKSSALDTYNSTTLIAHVNKQYKHPYAQNPQYDSTIMMRIYTLQGIKKHTRWKCHDISQLERLNVPQKYES